ncbi:MAG TPA: OmpA family protein [Hyphomicrobiaceae bacterium]|nr:OmpA family protein [Hyphomicrobiaceae bacterium]
MSDHTVNKLKDLLFDRERSELEELSRRIRALHDRVGDDAHLRASVATVIDGALRDAEVARHRELADAIAPVVLRTVKTEIASSQDLLVESLYPRLGDLVRRYVVSTFRDFVDDLNRRLESKLPFETWSLKLRSIASGRSMAELALSDTSKFAVEEIYLIRRGSGELLEHWERPGLPRSVDDSDHDQRFSGILAAITAFADESFKGDEADLRSFNIGNRLLYIRASAAHLLAAKCRATAPPPIQSILDEEFVATLAEHRDRSRPAASGTPAPSSDAAVAALAGRLETRAREKLLALDGAPSRSGPLKWITALVVLPLLAWFGWQSYIGYQTSVTRQAALQVIGQSIEVKGYPIQLTVERGGHAMSLAGLAPSNEARAIMMRRLRDALPAVAITDQMNVLPVVPGAPDVGPQFEAMRGAISSLDQAMQRTALTQTIARAAKRLAATGGELQRLEMAAGGPARDVAREARAEIGRVEADLASLTSRIGSATAPADRELVAVQSALTRLSAVFDRLSERGPGSAAKSAPKSIASVADGAEELAALAERIAAAAQGFATTASLRKLEGDIASLPKPLPPRDDRPLIQALESTVTGLKGELKRLEDELARRPMPTGRAPTPREDLEAFVRSHAIFFANASDYRSDAAAKTTLDELARLMTRSTDVLRIVGYADERGGSTRNVTVSLARAQRVASELQSRGIPAARLVIVPRSNSIEISANTGPQSTNRRVEFEVGFMGESDADTGAGRAP